MLDPIENKTCIKTLFLGFFLVITALLNILVGISISKWFEISEIVYVILSQIVNLGIAYELTEWILALLVKKRDLPKLCSLDKYPSVAILHLTCNDFNPAIVSSLRNLTYPNLAFFILDDSTQIEYQRQIDLCGFIVIRRKQRKSFKAGNLNHWLENFGKDFDYFIVLDNDSLIPADFVEEMIKYAEHDSNQDVAILQSSIQIWNHDDRFAKTLDIARSLRMYVSKRIDNPCDTLFPTTNVLARTAAIKMIGGFGTHSTTEDWETGLELIARGFRCQLVDIPSYVSMSISAREHTKRMARWAGGILEIAQKGIKDVPLTTNLRLLMGIYFYMIWPVYVAGLVFVIVWSPSPLWNNLGLSQDLVHRALLFSNNPLFFFSWLLIIHFTYFLFLRPLMAHGLGISLRNYVEYVFLASAVGFYAFAPLLKAQILVLVGKRYDWEEKVSESSNVAFFDLIFKEMRMPIIILGIIVTGLIQNPITIFFNFPWLLLLFLSPFVLYLWQRPNKNILHRNSLSNSS